MDEQFQRQSATLSYTPCYSTASTLQLRFSSYTIYKVFLVSVLRLYSSSHRSYNETKYKSDKRYRIVYLEFCKIIKSSYYKKILKKILNVRWTHQFVTLSQFVAIFSYFLPLMKQMIKNRTIIIVNIILNE